MKQAILHDRRLLRRSALVIALLTVAVYLPALGNGFVNWDDNLYIYNNTHIRSLDGRFFHWAFTTFYAANWHPLTWISHAVDYALWGLDPRGHHLTGIVLHGLNTFLVVLLASKLLTVFRERSGAAFPDERSTLIAAGVTGLLFGIHPLHVESVAWVSERKDLLCAFFYLMSLLAYEDFARDPGKGGTGSYVRRPYLFALLFFALALLSKPMAVSLPVVLLILDWHPFGRLSSRKELRHAVIEKLPFFFLGAASAVVTVMAQRSGDAISPFKEIPGVDRLLVASRAAVSYLGKMVLPRDLLPFYPFPSGITVLAPTYAFSLALMLGMVAACIVLAKKRKGLAAAGAWYLVTLLPVIGIVQVGDQSMADRYTYLPSLGPFLLVGALAAKTWTAAKRSRPRMIGPTAAVLTAAVLAVVLSLATIRQTLTWKNSIVLWDRVIAKSAGPVPQAYTNRGLAFQDEGRLDLAMADFTTAIRLDPSFAEAYIDRGIALRQQGRIDEAIADYTKAVTRKPSFAAGYNNRGVAEMAAGRTEQAIADFSSAIALAPSYVNALLNRCKAYTELARYDGAISDCAAVLKLDPRSVEAHLQRGVAFGETGELGRAVEDFSEAIDLDPSRAEAWYDRGLAYEGMEKNDLAVREYRTACEGGSSAGCAALQRLSEGRRGKAE